MADLQNTSEKRNKTGKRMNKKSTKVDLTPMVDLGFLLITFFVFTTTMAQPRVMGLLSPNDSEISTEICETCALTVLPAAGNKVYYYEGTLQATTVLNQTSFTAEGLRALLLNKKQQVKKVRGNEDELALIIRPTDKSTYRNFVDVLDEVHITGVKRYFIDEITENEKQLMANSRL